MDATLKSRIETLVNASPVLLFMKGNKLMPQYSEWPTIPQIYVKGEFLGGSDILIELYNSGELKEKLAIALAS